MKLKTLTKKKIPKLILRDIKMVMNLEKIMMKSMQKTTKPLRLPKKLYSVDRL
jgi:hypothetical protein